MTSSHRIVLNAAATYGRSLIAIVLALFSSRWVLHSLGQSDYGLYTIVGSLIIFVIFLNGVLASSVVRHLSFAIGKGDLAEVNDWFNTAFFLHLVVAFLLVMVGWPLGNWIVNNILNIPSNRIQTCLFVYQLSLLSAFATMISVPFVAMFTAKQRIFELAINGLLLTFCTFCVAWHLQKIEIDRLKFYAAGMVTSIVAFQILQITRGFWLFSECRINPRKWLHVNRLKQLGSFASWNLIGSSGTVLRDEGAAVLLNLYFGPVVNSAYGIATQVSNQTNQLSIAMTGAFTPEITSSEGRGDRQNMLLLANRTSKFGAILSILFALPIFLEMETILKIWLVSPPEYAMIFCRIILSTFVIDRITSGFMIAINANGKIKWYQITVGTIQLLNFPVAWILLRFNFPPTAVVWCFIATMIAITASRVYWAKKIFNISVKSWLINVCSPILFSTVSAIAIFIPISVLAPTITRVLISASATTATCVIITWFFGTSYSEKEFVIKTISSLTKRLIKS